MFLLTVWSYLPALGGTFLFDDYHNISGNKFLKIDHFSFEGLWQAALSSDSGPFKRPVAMLSFAINHVLSGMDPWWMKVTNLFIHLSNGLLVMLIMRQLIHRVYGQTRTDLTYIPCFIMAIWLTHPVNVTAVSYIVQRMTSLSATFVLLAIYSYVNLRECKSLNLRTYILSFSIMLFWILGLLTKETGILLSIYVFVIEWCVYSFKTHTKTEKMHLGIVWGLLSVPWICALLYILYDPSFILNGYANRSFTIIERVLTEFRIVSEYIRLIVFPDIGVMGLFHDEIILSTSVLSPISTLFSLVFMLSIVVLAIKIRKTYSLISLGLLWFFGGQVLESTVFPLELMFLHRNYLPSIGLLMVIALIVVELLKNHRRLAPVAAILILISFSLSTRSLNYQWSGDLRMLLIEVINNPNSVRANFRAGQTFKMYSILASQKDEKEEYRNKAIEYFRNIRTLDSKNVSGDLGILETHLQLKEIPPRELVTYLIQTLPVAKVDRGVINVFISYKNCFIEGECPLKPEDFEKLIAALFSNQYIGSDIKRIILIIKAEYFAEYHNNVDVAIPNVLEAIILESNLEDFMLLARFYEKGSYYNEMKRTINYMEEHDRLGRFRNFIKEKNIKYKKEISVK